MEKAVSKIKDKLHASKNFIFKLAKNHYMLSFVLPMVIFLIALYFNRVFPIHPNGDQSILIVDFLDQYFPFIYEFNYRIRTGGSLLWSWNLGGGTSYILHYAYYLTSPFNLLAVLFPSTWLREVLTVFVVIKIGLAGLLMAYYLSYISKKKDLLLPTFASMYALCGWVLAYYHNIMWLDVVYIAPLVILGTHKLILKGKYKLYVVTLALSVFLNFHIAFMLGLFVILYFFAIATIHYNGFKQFLIRGGFLFLSTLLAIGLMAWLIIPVFVTLLSFNRFQSDTSIDFVWVRNWYELFSEFLAFNANPSFARVVEFGAPPNVYTSLMPLMLLPVFLVTKKIKMKVKVIYTTLLVFLVLSVNNDALQFGWHGFSTTIGFPFRFSFVLSFLLVTLAYKVYIAIVRNDIEKKELLALPVGLVPFLLAGHFSMEEEKNVLIYNYALALVLIAIVVLLYIARKNNYKKILKPLKMSLGLIVFFELTFSSFFATSMTREYSSVHNYSEILMDQRLTHDDHFFRTEFTRMNQSNEISLNQNGVMNGISVWSSAVNQSTLNFYQNIGFATSKWSGSYIYAETSPLTNAFLNIRYLIERDDNPAGDEHFFERVVQREEAILLRNNYYLPLGFMANSDLRHWQGNADRLFSSQNELFRAATGLEGDLFEIHTLTYDSADGIYRFDFVMPREGDLFSVSTLGSATQLYAYPDLIRSIRTTYPSIHHLGSFDAELQIRLGFHLGEARGERTIEVAIIDRDLFAQGHAILNRDTLDIISFSDTRIVGTIDVTYDGILYTSIPYDHGNWRAYVNGERADLTLINGAMVGVELESGSFEIEFRYVNISFNLGLGISLASLVIFVALFMKERYRGKAIKDRGEEDEAVVAQTQQK